MIYIRASKFYYTGKLRALLARLDFVTQEQKKTPSIPDSALFAVWSDIGRILLFASETLTDTEYYQLLAGLKLICPPDTKPLDFKNYYIFTTLAQNSQNH